MTILKKYESNIIISTENFIFLNKFQIKTKKIKINYIFDYKLNFFRNFINIYSLFLVCNFFSFLNFKNKSEFVLKIPIKNLLISEYNNFLF